MPALYDLFFSYARRDKERVLPIVDALGAAGLRVWFDQTDVPDFSSVSQSIRTGLAHSKSLVAFYSSSYPQRHACQWELTAAFIAAQQEGAVSRRVLVINPERGADHIDPIELRDANFAAAPAPHDSVALQALARKVHGHLQAIEGPLSDIRPLEKPRWFPNEGTRYRYFVGRTNELWRIHSLLHARDVSAIVSKGISGLAQVTGLGGVGKSLLAEEYALRFGAAYPGGVFWLRAYGNDEARGVLSPDERETAREDQMREFAAKLGIAVKGKTPAEIDGDLASAIEQRGFPCLWVVDDAPSGLNEEALRRWFAPHPLARTLITTRSLEYENLAESLHLGVLPAADALELLTSRRLPESAQERDAAGGIVQALGGHALAIDVTAAALKRAESHFTFESFRAELAEPRQDVLKLAAELAHELPNGHQKNIASTLAHSLRLLGEEGWDFLRLASVLSVAPISPTFVGVVFTLADESDPTVAQNRSLRAALDAEDLSLAEKLEGGLCTVHPLVSRIVRLQDATPERTQHLRAAVVKVVVILLSGTAEDPHLHQGVELEVAHARELARVLHDEADSRLITLLAQHDYAEGAYRSAAALLWQQVEYCRRSSGPEHPDTLAWTSALANAVERAGDVAGARLQHEEVLGVRLPRLGPEHEDTLTSLNDLASALAAQGDLGRAGQLHEQVLRVRRRVLGPAHDDTLTSMNNVAEVRRRVGDLAGARILHEEVLEASRQALGPEHPKTLTSMNNLGLTLRSQGELDKARALLEKSLEIHRRTLGPQHPDTLNAMVNLAETLRAQGQVQKARALQEEALEFHRRMLSREHPQTSVIAWNLLQTLRQLREREKTRAVLENDLLWLLEQPPETLGSEQRQIREWITTIGVEALTSQRSPWWSRLLRGLARRD